MKKWHHAKCAKDLQLNKMGESELSDYIKISYDCE